MILPHLPTYVEGERSSRMRRLSAAKRESAAGSCPSLLDERCTQRVESAKQTSSLRRAEKSGKMSIKAIGLRLELESGAGPCSRRETIHESVLVEQIRSDGAQRASGEVHRGAAGGGTSARAGDSRGDSRRRPQRDRGVRLRYACLRNQRKGICLVRGLETT